MVHSVDASQLPQRQVWNVIHGFMPLDNAVPREGLSLSVSDGVGSRDTPPESISQKMVMGDIA